MKLLLKVCLAIFLVNYSSGSVRNSCEDLNRACLIRFFQIRGKLDESVISSPAPSELCRVLLPSIYANRSEQLCLKLWETKSVKAGCIFETLKKSEFIDLELKLDIYANAKGFGRSARRRKIYEATRHQREILVKAAKCCRSDPTYGGLFDGILGINSSVIILHESYCLVKYVLENKFISLSNINANPKSIDVSAINCLVIVTRFQENNKQKLLEAFRKRKYSPEAITCLIGKYHNEKIFGWNLARHILTRLNIVESDRRSEDWRISKALSEFNKQSSNCLHSFNWTHFW